MSSPIDIHIPEFDADAQLIANKLNCPLWAAHLIDVCHELHYGLQFIEDKLIALESKLDSIACNAPDVREQVP